MSGTENNGVRISAPDGKVYEYGYSAELPTIDLLLDSTRESKVAEQLFEEMGIPVRVGQQETDPDEPGPYLHVTPGIWKFGEGEPLPDIFDGLNQISSGFLSRFVEVLSVME